MHGGVAKPKALFATRLQRVRLKLHDKPQWLEPTVRRQALAPRLTRMGSCPQTPKQDTKLKAIIRPPLEPPLGLQTPKQTSPQVLGITLLGDPKEKTN